MSEPFLLSSYAARFTDYLVYAGNKNWCLKPATLLLSRLNNAIFFQALVALDVLGHAARGLGEWGWSKLSSNADSKKEHYEHAKMNCDTFKRCVLGTLCAQATWFAHDIVSQHFLTKSTTPGVIEFNGKLYSAKADMKTPTTIEEVQDIVREAARDGIKVSVVGAGMSQGKQALPPDPENGKRNIVLNLSKLKNIEIDADQRMARVRGSVTWSELQHEANKSGLAIQVMQASNVFSIPGSISVNCHGWDHRAGAVANTVRSITIVDADGDVRKLYPEDDLFKCVAGGYGGFGVIVEADIDLTDNDYLEEWGEEVAPKDYIDYFKNVVQKDDDIAMHLYRLSLDPKDLLGTGVAVSYSKTGQAGSADKLTDEPKRGKRIERVELHGLRRLWWARKFAWLYEMTNALKAKVSTRNEIMRPSINPVFNHSMADTEWLQEYFVKEEDLADFLKFLGGVLMENGVPLFNASVRYVKKDERALLGYATGGDRFAVVLFFNQSLVPAKVEKTRKWVQKVIDYLAEREGTFYLPYQHFATREQFQTCYPRHSLQAGYKSKYDPNGVFQNGIYQDYIS